MLYNPYPSDFFPDPNEVGGIEWRVMWRTHTQRGQHVVEVLLVDEAIPVLVNHVEGLLELLDLGLVKHGKHVGRGPLGAFLGGLALGALA